jgi:hypothetical protein
MSRDLYSQIITTASAVLEPKAEETCMDSGKDRLVERWETSVRVLLDIHGCPFEQRGFAREDHLIQHPRCSSGLAQLMSMFSPF